MYIKENFIIQCNDKKKIKAKNLNKNHKEVASLKYLSWTYL